MTDWQVLSNALRKGDITLNQARAAHGLPSFSGDFGNWPLNLPPGTGWQAPGPHGPGGLLLPCSYCKAAKGHGRCRNCGAPA